MESRGEHSRQSRTAGASLYSVFIMDNENVRNTIARIALYPLTRRTGGHIDYAVLKLIHVTCVVVSYVMFVFRGVWMMRASPSLHRRWVRVVPHVVDTVLLASAIAMVVMLRQYPWAADWLTAKVLALLCYIGLGMIALTRGRTRRTRVLAWIAAQAAFFYIVAVAITRTPLPWSMGV
jgi:uncharacterized membrane protein SirB2